MTHFADGDFYHNATTLNTQLGLNLSNAGTWTFNYRFVGENFNRGGFQVVAESGGKRIMLNGNPLEDGQNPCCDTSNCNYAPSRTGCDIIEQTATGTGTGTGSGLEL